jgi:hypothetical protein
MQHELVFRAITQGSIGIIFLTLLVGLLYTLRKDIRTRRLSWIVVFALAMMGLWCFFALAEVYVSLHKMIVSQTAPQ